MLSPFFWRYGELGRKVTLDPIKVANTFHAPLLTGGRQHAKERGGDIEALIDVVGHKQVQYEDAKDEQCEARDRGTDESETSQRGLG